MHAMHKPKSKGESMHRKGESIPRSLLHVLSCLDTRKNHRKSRLKSPTRWVPRRRNCRAILFAPPAAWLMWYRLPGPPPRSTPDPLADQAFMPLLASFAHLVSTFLLTRAFFYYFTNNKQLFCHPEQLRGITLRIKVKEPVPH